MITVLLENNIVSSVIESANKPIMDLKEGQSLIEVSSAPEIGLEYNSANKTFVESSKTKFSKIRTKRNLLLVESDYTQLSDSVHKGNKEEWKIYRQKLRDITKDITDPDVIEFPEEPK
tara:strand:- start:12459 stop:12812 length:354 start_codon:yes stop_codon:yes gene_type:complete